MACDDGVLADDANLVYLTPWTQGAAEPTQVRDRMPELAEEDKENARRVIASFEEQPEVLLERPGVTEILGQVERSYLLSGNYFRLVDIYHRQFERYGTDSVAAIALAWVYVQLGNEVELEKLKSQLVQARPDDPLTWVIVGEANMRRATESLQAAARARDGFEKVLELDPEFREFKSLNRTRLEQQLQWLRTQVPDDVALEDIEEEATAPMHHLDGTDPSEQAVVTAEEEEEVEQQQRQEAEDRAEAEAQELAPNIAEVAESMADDVLDGEDEAAEEEMVDEEAMVDEQEPEKQDQRRQALRYVLSGQQALQQGGGRLSEARRDFEQALEYDPDHVDAKIGLLRVDARLDSATRAELTEGVDQLAEGNLTAQQAYDLGLFCLRSLNDRDRATSLLKRVEEKDPSFARRVGVDSLLQ